MIKYGQRVQDILLCKKKPATKVYIQHSCFCKIEKFVHMYEKKYILNFSYQLFLGIMGGDFYLPYILVMFNCFVKKHVFLVIRKKE